MNIIIVGGKGNGTVVLSAILDMNANYNSDYNFLGFVNDNFETIKKIDNYPVIGHFSDIETICLDNDAYFINAITSTKTIKIIFNKYLEIFPNFRDRLISIIHPSSFIGYNVNFGRGVFIGPQNYIGQNVNVFDMVFVHSQCYIARDAKILDNSYLAPQVYIGAEAKVLSNVYLGINALVKERLTIKEGCIIGMGSIIVKSTNANGVYFGKKAIKRN